MLITASLLPSILIFPPSLSLHLFSPLLSALCFYLAAGVYPGGGLLYTGCGSNGCQYYSDSPTMATGSLVGRISHDPTARHEYFFVGSYDELTASLEQDQATLFLAMWDSYGYDNVGSLSVQIDEWQNYYTTCNEQNSTITPAIISSGSNCYMGGVNNGYPNTCYYPTSGTTCTIGCYSGYYLYGADHLTCNNGIFLGEQICLPQACPPLAPVTGGTWSYRSRGETNETFAYQNNYAYLTCNVAAGYVPTNYYNFIYCYNNIWNYYWGSVGCQLSSCTYLQDPQNHGTWSNCPYCYSTQVSVGGQATLSCNDGYYPSSAIDAAGYRCIAKPDYINNVAAQWDPLQIFPVCLPAVCPQHPTIPGGQWTYQTESSYYGSNAFNTTVNMYSYLTCGAGYTLQGNNWGANYIQCVTQPNGKAIWDPNNRLPTCLVSQCYVGGVSNGYWSSNYVSVGQSTTLTCYYWTNTVPTVTSMTCQLDPVKGLVWSIDPSTAYCHTLQCPLLYDQHGTFTYIDNTESIIASYINQPGIHSIHVLSILCCCGCSCTVSVLFCYLPSSVASLQSRLYSGSSLLFLYLLCH